jgi:hypothetical protein
MATRPSHPPSCLPPIIRPGVPIGRPVGTPIGTRVERSTNTRRLLTLVAPHTQTRGRHERIGVDRFIERQGDGPSHLTRHRDERAGRDRGRIKELFPQCDEPTLGCAEVCDRLEGGCQRQLEDFNSRSLFESAGSQHFAAECHGLSGVGFRGGPYLCKGQRRRAGRGGLSLTSSQGTAGEDNGRAKTGRKKSAH